MTPTTVLRIAEKVSLARSLSVLQDHAGADAVWDDVKRDVYAEAHHTGLNSPHGTPCQVPGICESNALAPHYLEAFIDGQTQRFVLTRSAAAA